MRITILAAGSRGDVQPYLALGTALKARGYNVRLATFDIFADFVQSYGLEFYPVAGDLKDVLNGEIVRNAMRADNPLKVIRSFNQLKSYVYGLQKDFYEASQGAAALIYHPGAANGYFISEHLHIPGILATPFPMTPTREYPAMIFYEALRGKQPFYRTSHRLTESIMWMASSQAARRFWKQQWGRLPERFGNPFPRQNTSSHPTIISGSSFVFPRPADWPAQVHNPGYWFLDDPGDWQPPAGLVEFLAGGSPPIYVGFGSLGEREQAGETTRLVLAALQRAGQRGILATGWQGLAQIEELPPSVYLLESAPHSWLFPKMAAAVHHGGAGTTAASFGAGIPTITIPHANDQFAWGRRAFELGVGAEPVPRKRLTAEKLAEAIRFALAGEVTWAARELGDKIRGENGAAKAAEIVDRCIAGFNENES